jgi:apolipoprotein N-acyltransferase
VFLVRHGKLAGRYDKLRLVPFAEEDQLGWLASHNRLVYESGRRLSVLPTATARVGAFVCFEAMYPDFVRGFARQGAEVLANPSNDDWFDHAIPARYMLDMASVRAIENRRYLVRPTTTGFSAVIDPHGRTVARSDFGTPAILTASIYPSRVQTPYQLWGDAVSWLAIAAVVVVSLLQVWRPLQRMRTEVFHELPTSIV